jgi:hypothetical protein
MLWFLVPLVGNDFGHWIDNAPIFADGTIYFIIGTGLGFGFLLAHFFSLLTIALYYIIGMKSRMKIRCYTSNKKKDD